MCRVSAVLMSTGNLFQHCGARTANSCDFVERRPGPPLCKEVESQLAVAERNGQAVVFVCPRPGCRMGLSHSQHGGEVPVS